MVKPGAEAAVQFASYHAVEFLPGPEVGDGDEALAAAAAIIGTTIFHPVGTAKKMGLASGPTAVSTSGSRYSGRGAARSLCFG